MNNDVPQIGWAREDSAQDVLVKTLARRVAVEAFHWLDLETIDYQWHWSGINPEMEPKLSGKVFGPDGRPIRYHGHIKGEPLEPEARMYRDNLTAFKMRKPLPAIVIIAHDGDRRSMDRPRPARTGRSRSRAVHRGSPNPFTRALRPGSQSLKQCSARS